MVALTSAVLGPPRHGLSPMACGWHCEMTQGVYDSDAKVEADMKSLDFLAECGVDYVSDCHPWGGETNKMNKLVDDQPLQISPFNRKFVEHAEKVGVKVSTWMTMNNSNPWGQENPFGRTSPSGCSCPMSSTAASACSSIHRRAATAWPTNPSWTGCCGSTAS